MTWFWQSDNSAETTREATPTHLPPRTKQDESSQEPNVERSESILANFATLEAVTSTFVLTSTALLSVGFYKRKIRRIPTTLFLKPSNFPARTSSRTKQPAAEPLPGPSLFGKVTSIHDPDNFRFYHTPGGRLLGWSTFLRPVPSTKQALKDQTISVRLAGIDAPELSHFGKPAQPYGAESLEFLKSILEGKRVRIYPLKRDQYDRVVCLAFVSRGWLKGLTERWWEERPWVWRKDVGLEILRAGMATIYEGKVGARFGGEAREQRYRAAEKLAQAQKIGMWAGPKGLRGATQNQRFGLLRRIARFFAGKQSSELDDAFESPHQFKARMARLDKEQQDSDKSKKLNG